MKHSRRPRSGARSTITSPGSAARIAVVVGLLVATLVPIYWMTVESLKTDAEQALGRSFWVADPSLSAYVDVLATTPFPTWAANSLIVLAGTTVVTLTSSLMAGYGLSHCWFPGRRWIARVLLVTYVVPQTLLFLPLYLAVITLDLENNLLSLILTYPALAIPFCSWLLLNFFQSLPSQIEEAATMEGGDRWRIFRDVLLPLATPVLIAAAVFTVGTSASEFLYATIFLPNAAHQTLAAGMGLTQVDPDQLGGIVAGANLAALPVILLCAGFSRYYIRGLTAAMLEGA